MDKLRAIQYFVAAADIGSFAGAARHLEVSVPAVQKLLGALERDIGLTLFERHAKGVKLTGNGSTYLECCRPLLGELSACEMSLKRSAQRPSGNLVVAVHAQLAHHLLLPELPRFHAEFPDIQIDFRIVHRLDDADAMAADILLLHGWPQATQDYVHRKLGLARSRVVAAPEYWATHGQPATPQELSSHTCLLVRNPAGILLDLWEFTRGHERVSVPVNGWLSSNSREVVLESVLAGRGVGRFNVLTTRKALQSGRLVPTLKDWDVQGGPPVNLLYKASARRLPRARVFIEFAMHLLEDLQLPGEPAPNPISADRPAWHRRGYGRASTTQRRGA